MIRMNSLIRGHSGIRSVVVVWLVIVNLTHYSLLKMGTP